MGKKSKSPDPGRRSELSAAQMKKILRERAKVLSREPEKKATAGEYLEVLEFSLAFESYAIETAYVREVYPLKNLTPLPCTPDFILGLINVRGQILSVMDIKKFFSLPEKGLSELNKIIILKAGELELGVLADSILGVRTLPAASIQPPPGLFSGIHEKYLRGVTGAGVIVLDAGKLLSGKEIIVNEEVEI